MRYIIIISYVNFLHNGIPIIVVLHTVVSVRNRLPEGSFSMLANIFFMLSIASRPVSIKSSRFHYYQMLLF